MQRKRTTPTGYKRRVNHRELVKLVKLVNEKYGTAYRLSDAETIGFWIEDEQHSPKLLAMTFANARDSLYRLLWTDHTPEGLKIHLGL